ncbi:MAG: 4'-phosphopantetheinyl transferase superfamily protein [Spirochaetales bacterium]|nr:4'-phosphopantetheinyl transferase superfamily protein [Spirochaetales bacterium]
MCELYGVRREKPVKPDLYEYMLSGISTRRRERILRFRRKEDAERALIAEILIRAVICRKFNVVNDSIDFETNTYGKPFLRGCGNFHFNLSHAGEWVVCIVGCGPVGVDVERIHPVSLTIAKRFFSPEEYLAILEKDPVRQLSYFFELWTLKESYIKAIGKGMACSLSSFTIGIMKDGIRLTSDTGSGPWFFRQYDIGPGYKCAACGTRDAFPERIVIEDLEGLAGTLSGSGAGT